MWNLPDKLRPRGSRYRRLSPGLDFPTSFLDDLKGIDHNFYLVWHPFRMLWDSIINADAGGIEDPRYEIHEKYGELNFGFVLTNGEGAPVSEPRWHLWRLCEPHGWAHVLSLASQEGGYLRLVAYRMHLQAMFHDKYGGARAYQKLLDEANEEQRAKMRKDEEMYFNAWQEENQWLIDKAKDNFSRGVTAPTNPTKETVMSYSGQSKRSKLVTPLGDEAGGLIIPGR